MRLARDLHPVAWWCWAVGLAVGASCTTNPFLLGLLLVVATITVFACRGDQPWARSFRLYLWLGLIVLVVRVLFRLLVGGNDAGHVLVALPEIPLPDWAAGVSLLGPFSREELVAAVYEGLRLSTLLIAVGAANALANPKRLMRSLPPALYEIGTAMVVAITVIPQLADSARRVRAAQQLRGGDRGRVRGLRRLLVPILEDAFERSLSLAAGMDARGYGRSGTATVGQRRTTGALMILGLLGVGVGVYAFLDSTAPRVLAWPMLAVGVVAALAGFVTAGRRVERTRYRPERWQPIEFVVAGSGLAVGAALWAVLHWDPLVAHPGVLGVPALSLGALLGVLVGVVPVFVAPPPLTAQNRAAIAPEPTSEPSRVAV
ncbi:energy-coupling factor transporter transmembrane component T [Nocardioides antri]|uniref:Energy-coupling factor transporter transmembrane protein EcfT n=1 Tax=Nocardioides antri TaxID=2607659 RepID=A0A5B1LYI0_9ACTN|nr:energy-coupling factor transporter transmembrane component T [Nocardioides antri]KAA1425631.1 energy-coupling factor transporter transmembrane protein EcfT [Nocardioides antri]